MIHFLKGIIEEIGVDYLAVDVQGIGYLVYASSRTLGAFATGEVAKIHVRMQVREDDISLFGFAKKSERDVFETLLNVSGVGAKVALSILSTLTPEEVVTAIRGQDGKMLTRASGVGPKLGERIVRELKDKAGGLATVVLSHDVSGLFATPSAPESTQAQGVAADVVSALVNLGYKPVQAQQAVNAVLRQAGDSEPEPLFDTLFRAALGSLR